ncbi:LysR substrate-binding domain-containing protein [Halomonas sabkhae]|uniref:LysR family transcriptional regulator n=1 Tax=Halomonas sabkhae TaxID=626223 RepID=UPI0025B2888A|nr:LysR family transcriptional regulator [Halomonas sabkhae]MDN3526439.1 LysR substrate-binding domain-containing protein [Halomonas sabkhae]
MEIRWLEDFIALARTRHFSRAAEEQNVTQPTFSRRIKLLEDDMGATLINRQTLPLSLTPEGEEFLGLCQDVTRRVADTRQRLGSLAEHQAAGMRLAASQSLLANFLPEWLAGWSRPPDISPYLRATGWLTPDYFQALGRDECDLVMCYWPVDEVPMEFDTADFDYRRLGTERLVPVSLPTEDGVPRFALDPPSHQPLPLIAYHPRSMVNAALRRHLDARGASPTFNVLNESIQSGNIRELVGLGYGIGWLPERSVTQALASGRLVLAGNTSWCLPLDIRLYRRHVAQSAVDALWQELDDSVTSKRDVGT